MYATVIRFAAHDADATTGHAGRFTSSAIRLQRGLLPSQGRSSPGHDAAS
jgi:hypothetical protein